MQNRAWVFWAKGDLNKAVADLDTALRLDPDNLDLVNDRVSILDDKGDYERAIAEYDKILASQPDNGGALNGRAWAYAHQGQLDKALADSERAVSLLGDEPNAIHTRAWIHMNKGELDLALADFDRTPIAAAPMSSKATATRPLRITRRRRALHCIHLVLLKGRCREALRKRDEVRCPCGLADAQRHSGRRRAPPGSTTRPCQELADDPRVYSTLTIASLGRRHARRRGTQTGR